MKKQHENLCTKNNILFMIIFFLSYFLIGCGTRMEIVPEITRIDNIDYHISGEIIYEGNTEYLPSVLIHKPGTESEISFKYTHEEIYGQYDIPDVVAFINPLTIVGFPTGENKLTVVGRLVVLKDKEVKKSYSAYCILEKTQSLFASETYSELRKKGLIEVKNNIDQQLYRDRDYLRSLLSIR